MANESVSRFLGGPPLAVLGRLVLLSILVGVILRVLGLDPWNIVQSLQNLLHYIWTMGFDLISRLWAYFLLGAAVVVPVWLIVRLVRVPRERG